MAALHLIYQGAACGPWATGWALEPYTLHPLLLHILHPIIVRDEGQTKWGPEVRKLVEWNAHRQPLLGSPADLMGPGPHTGELLVPTYQRPWDNPWFSNLFALYNDQSYNHRHWLLLNIHHWFWWKNHWAWSPLLNITHIQKNAVEIFKVKILYYNQITAIPQCWK